MPEHRTAVAFYDGQWLPADQIAIPWWDMGFAMGASAVEQLRTYDGRLPLLDEHMKRLRRGLTRLKLENIVSIETVRSAIDGVANRNYELLELGSDLGICAVVTAGGVPAFVPATIDLRRALAPKVLVHSFPLPFTSWQEEFRHGIRLATSTIRAVDAASFPTDFKHRSRLHCYLAQREVDERSPGCRPLLLTADGQVADATTAGILIFRENQWIAPRLDQALNSVSVGVVEELLNTIGIGFVRRSISTSDLSTADEAIWCSTPTGLLPVIELDGRPIASGRAGPQFHRLAELWSQRVGVDYRKQVLDSLHPR